MTIDIDDDDEICQRIRDSIDDENKAKAERKLEILRDYFAGKAMAGFLYDFSTEGNDAIARMSYELADAMLRQRSKS